MTPASSTGRDDTEPSPLRRSEILDTALRASEAEARKLALVAQHTDNAVILTDASGLIEWTNAGFTRITGFSLEEVVGRKPGSFLQGAETDPATVKYMRERIREGINFQTEIVNYGKNGRKYWLAVEVRVLRDAEGKILQFMAIESEITARKQVEEELRRFNEGLEKLVEERTAELRASEERFRQMAEQSREVFWFIGVNPARVLYISPAVERIWGLSPEAFYGDPQAGKAAIHPEDRSRIDTAYDSWVAGAVPTFDEEYRIFRPNGSLCWVQDVGTLIRNPAGEIVRISGISRDITERKMAELQMLRTQRLESIGNVAGGVAHDLNNALAPIMMGLELLRAQNPESIDILNTMESSARRGAAMVRQVLTFAKGANGDRLLIDTRNLLVEIEKIVNAIFPKNIQLRTAYGKKLSSVLGDTTQLHQVLLNLCVNARDAMPTGGTLTLEAANVILDAAQAKSIPKAKPGKYVVWHVKDTGTGIPAAIVDRIFEPFFSTKGPDKGTGLGLSTVLGIVNSHGGFVQIQSTPGKGTVFSVYLPANPLTAGDTNFVFTPDVFRGRGETILVVDDELTIRELTRTVLMSLNFKVITAINGTDALSEVAKVKDELRVVITDLHMPHMDGLIFVRMLKRIAAGTAIIVTSGNFEEKEIKDFKELGVRALLDKPFTQQQLSETLKSVLTEAGRDAV